MMALLCINLKLIHTKHHVPLVDRLDEGTHLTLRTFHLINTITTALANPMAIKFLDKNISIKRTSTILRGIAWAHVGKVYSRYL